MNLIFEPIIAPALWVTLAVAGGAALVWYALRRPSVMRRGWWSVIIGGMTLGLTALLLVLLNPTWVIPIPPPAGKPVLTVFVDSSGSMSILDADGAVSRLVQAVAAAEAAGEELQSDFDIRVQSFAGYVTPLDPGELKLLKADGRSSDLAGALAAVLAEDHPQGQAVLVLSDGIHNAASGIDGLISTAEAARAMNIPVYSIPFGSDVAPADLEVAVLRPGELSFSGQDVPVEVRVRQRGAITDRVELVLLRDGEEVDRREARLQADQLTTVPFSVHEDRPGLYRYEVRTDAMPREATDVNNSASFLLRVVSQPIRVLVLEGKPYWDSKFLLRTLATDPSVEVDCAVRLRADRYLHRKLTLQSRVGESGGADSEATTARSETTEFIASPDSLIGDENSFSQWQIIVLGRDAEAFLSDDVVERLRQWISRDGGSLVCFRGSPVASANQELSRLMPVRWTTTRETRFRPSLTGRGQSLAWLNPGGDPDGGILTRMPSLATSATPERPRPLASVLARTDRGDGPPVVSWHSYGTGRVVAVEGAGMWRWAFLPPEHEDYASVYATIWQSLLRWLVSGVGLTPGAERALRTDRITYTQGEDVHATLLMREDIAADTVPEIALYSNGNETPQHFQPTPSGDEPGVYDVSFGELPDGQYRAELLVAPGDEDTAAEPLTVAFDVRPFLGEQLDVRIRSDILTRLATETGGQVLDADTVGSIGALFNEHLTASRPVRVRKVPAWDRWWVLLGILALWGTTWAIRRRGGLV